MTDSIIAGRVWSSGCDAEPAAAHALESEVGEPGSSLRDPPAVGGRRSTGRQPGLETGLRNGHLLAGLALCFLAPNLLMGALLDVPARVIVGLGVTGAAVFLWRGAPRAGLWSSQPVRALPLALCMGLGFVLVCLGGEGHLVFANSDWFWRDAVLADLSRQPELPRYRVSGDLWFLRAPLGMYLAPAVFGRLFGLAAAQVALVVQNAALLGGMLYAFQSRFPRRPVVALGAMVAYSGLAVVGALLVRAERHLPVDPLDLTSHIDTWSPYWQYSSQVTQLFWAPNHALPGWWVALLALLAEDAEISLAWMGLCTAALAVWSPFAVLGGMPFLVHRFVCSSMREARDVRFWTALVLSTFFLPIAAYLAVGAQNVGAEVETHRPLFALLYMQFVSIMLIPAVIVLGEAIALRRPERPLLGVALFVLLLLPFLRVGEVNELVMRASIPALTIMAFAFGRLIGVGWSGGAARWAAACLVGVIGLAGPAAELTRIALFPAWGLSRCDLPTVQAQLGPGAVSSNYMALASRAPSWLLPRPSGTPQAAVAGPCWPDFPFDPRMWVWEYGNSALAASKQARRRAGL